MENTINKNTWQFPPHDDKRHSDIAVANIISSALANGRVESQLIWQRYSAMLIANGLFLGFLLRTTENDKQFIISSALQIFACLVGISICFIWKKMTSTGWDLQKNWFDYVDSIDFASFPLPNPVRYFREKRNSCAQGTIYKSAISVIWIFIGSYSVTTLSVIVKIKWF